MLDWRWGSGALIAALSVAGVALPLKLGARQTTMLEWLQFFTGGVFLGAGVLHMLPEAVEEWLTVSMGTDMPKFVTPYLLFCAGYITIYAVEGQGHTDTSALHKHSILAMAQRAGSTNASASVCVVDVPPVKTYGAGGGGNASGLLAHQHQTPSTGGGGGGSYSHTGKTPSGSPAEHGHEHDHAQHEHGHGGCKHDHTQPLPPVQHDHSHAQPATRTERRPSWVDEESCCGGHGGGDEHDHNHVHVGVLHRHVVVVPEGAALTPLMPLIYALLFSVHSLIAGLALGVQSELGEAAIAILIAIVAHKFVEALSLAASFVREGVRLETSLAVLLVYCAMTPLGLALGYVLVSHGGALGGVAEPLLSSFAAGSFCYLASHELSSDHASLGRPLRAALALAGVGVMGLVSLVA